MEVTARAGDREAAVDMHHQMQFSIAGGGEAAGMTTVTRGWKRVAAGSEENSRKVLGYVVALLVCTWEWSDRPRFRWLGVRSQIWHVCHVAADPPTVLFFFRYASHGNFIISSWGPEGKVLW